jgi:hypothetical protein
MLLASGLAHLDGIDVRSRVHIRAKDDPFAVRRKRGVGFEPVIMPGQIHQLFNLEVAVVRSEEVNPLAVSGCGNRLRPATSPAKSLPSAETL